MSRILLVSSNRSQRPYPVPPLGLCLIAEHLASKHEVEVFDAMFRDVAELPGVIEKAAPDVVGLGVRNVDDVTMHSPRFYLGDVLEDFVRPIKGVTEAPLVLGGAGFSVLPGPILELLGGDYGVVGEGEAVFARLVEALEQGRSPAEIPGVITPAGGLAGYHVCSESLPGASLGPSHLERWIDFAPYRPRGSYALQTKRGCAHRCVYCTYPKIEGRTWRLRSAESIVHEISEASASLGPVTFEFVDSTFNDPAGHAEAVCNALIEAGLDVRLRTMGVNPRGVSPRLLASMKRAGFVQMDCTPDSASPSVLERLDKGFDRDDLERAALQIRDAAIPCMWFLLFGGPSESAETIAETLDFVDRFVAEDDMVYMSAGMRVYPGTPLREIAIEAGQVSPDADLLQPEFYVSPELGADRCIELVSDACATRPNCVPAWETAPSPELIARAMELRKSLPADFPMFRVLIRARRELMGL